VRRGGKVGREKWSKWVRRGGKESEKKELNEGMKWEIGQEWLAVGNFVWGMMME